MVNGASILRPSLFADRTESWYLSCLATCRSSYPLSLPSVNHWQVNFPEAWLSAFHPLAYKHYPTPYHADRTRISLLPVWGSCSLILALLPQSHPLPFQNYPLYTHMHTWNSCFHHIDLSSPSTPCIFKPSFAAISMPRTSLSPPIILTHYWKNFHLSKPKSNDAFQWATSSKSHQKGLLSPLSTYDTYYPQEPPCPLFDYKLPEGLALSFYYFPQTPARNLTMVHSNYPLVCFMKPSSL